VHWRRIGSGFRGRYRLSLNSQSRSLIRQVAPMSRQFVPLLPNGQIGCLPGPLLAGYSFPAVLIGFRGHMFCPATVFKRGQHHTIPGARPRNRWTRTTFVTTGDASAFVPPRFSAQILSLPGAVHATRGRQLRRPPNYDDERGPASIKDQSKGPLALLWMTVTAASLGASIPAFIYAGTRAWVALAINSRRA
jgi:hypothetical protein